MLKICLCSDNHGDIDSINEIKAKNINCDYYIHCGDSALPESELKPFISVKGNNDYEFDYPKQRILEIGGHRILVSHGQNYTFSVFGLTSLAKNNNCDVLFFGHTHQFFDDEYNGIRLINPGSTLYNRDWSNPCYALVNIDDNGKISVERIDL